MVEPKNWPTSIVYVNDYVVSKKLSSDDLLAIGVRPGAKRKPLPVCPLVRIKPILDANHPANGQYGLFASRKLAPGSHIIDYLGYLHPKSESDETSDYDIILEKQRGMAIDAQRWGNEARMINDYRGIRDKPNVKFDDHILESGELRIAIYVLDKPISAGEELCTNYGKGFWQARTET